MGLYPQRCGVDKQAKLVANDTVGQALFGTGATLSADGNTAIFGGFADNSFTGAAWVFTRSGGVWAQQGPKLVGTGAVGTSTQGNGVALSADSNLVFRHKHVNPKSLRV
jgi:hypothetical protein